MKAFARLASFALAVLMMTANAAFAGPLQPWKGNAQGHDVGVDADGLIHVVFSGEASHMGRYSGVGWHYVHDDLLFVGAATFRAANGDTLVVTYEGSVSVSDQPPTIVGKMTVIGGTGNFKNAIGEADFDGDTDQGAFGFDFDGKLGTKGKNEVGPGTTQ